MSTSGDGGAEGEPRRSGRARGRTHRTTSATDHHGERPRDARDPREVGRVRALQRLGEDPGRYERHREQRRRCAPTRSAPTTQPDGEPEQADVPMSIAKNHRNRAFDAARCGSRHHGGIGLGDAPAARRRGATPRRWARELPPGPEVERRGRRTSLATPRPSPADREVHPHRQRARRRSRRATGDPQAAPRATAASRAPGRRRRRGRGGRSGRARRGRRRPPTATYAGRRDSTSALARTANTALHSVRARPPFHAIAVSPIGVST